MRGEFATWVDRYLDHLLDAYDHDAPAILADNARALELDDPSQLPPTVLHLFRIDLEALRSDPEWPPPGSRHPTPPPSGSSRKCWP